MASTNAIATAATALVGLLEDARDPGVFPDLHVELYLTKELQTPRTTHRETVSLCAYRVAISTARRRLPPRVQSSDGVRYRPSVPVDAYFLVTAWAQDPEQQLRILGWVVRTFEDTAILPASFLNRFGTGSTPVFRPDESVELIADSVSQQDLYTIWQVAPTRQQPSLVYVARMLLLDSSIPLVEGPLVQTRVLDQREVVAQ